MCPIFLSNRLPLPRDRSSQPGQAHPLGAVVAAAAVSPCPTIFAPAFPTRRNDLGLVRPRGHHLPLCRGYVRTPAGTLQNATPPDQTDPSLCGTAEDAVRFAAALHSGASILRPRLEPLLNPGGEAETTGLGWNLTRRDGRREVLASESLASS